MFIVFKESPEMVSADTIKQIIIEALPSAKVHAHDMTGGGDHWQVKVVAKEFESCSLIEQHQMIYKALGSLMDKEIHALSLDTSAP